MQKERRDAVQFLELLIGECQGTDVHAWRKCRRCLAIEELRERSPLCRRFVETAIEALKR